MESLLDLIQGHPEIFAAYSREGLRDCRLRRFPYAIHYIDLDDAVWIVALSHLKRKPGYWKRRLRGI